MSVICPLISKLRGMCRVFLDMLEKGFSQWYLLCPVSGWCPNGRPTGVSAYCFNMGARLSICL